MSNFRVFHGELTSPIEAMEHYFREGKISIVEAAFKHSYFLDPEEVRAKPTYFCDRARYSRKKYPGKGRGQQVTLPDGRKIWLDDNQYAQRAWEAYTKRGLQRGDGYSIRHIWGHPWDPDCFTAGWNLCYMPFWAGMLTETQHPHPELEKAIKQASWDLYFRNNPVCEPPNFVEDPGMDLSSLLGEQPIVILGKSDSEAAKQASVAKQDKLSSTETVEERVKAIRSETHQSWSNIRKAARALQGLNHEPFGTQNVKASAKSCVRKICSETGLSHRDIEELLDNQGW